MFFTFLYILMHISLGVLSLSSAEAHIGRDRKLNVHLMASCVKNIYTKNYKNRIRFLQVTIENVGDVL